MPRLRKIIDDEDEDVPEITHQFTPDGEEGEADNVEEDGDELDPEDEEVEEDEIQSEDETRTATASPAKSAAGLKIRIKPRTNNDTTSTSGKAGRRRIVKRRASDSVESEDSLDSDEESVVRPSHPLTVRQAALAGASTGETLLMTELPPEFGGKRSTKRELNETEKALRREENARKRKNLSEKKLEDEKVETINRLLRKQTRPRNRRTTTNTPQFEDSEAEAASREEKMPTMYHWVSSKQGISFSIPPSVSLPPARSQAPAQAPDAMDVDTPPPPRVKSNVCALPNCCEPLKYRLVKDWTIGACGMAHLKALEAQTTAAAGNMDI
ncbi:PAPA-1-domain-containing protein [Fistulina hepatica ATCC 64428]|uniref:PAPA-1-domain-containing protein n=1 Tax=Fistulina hepatica ATCC 64428 TaxID=1128425 RepID=A0A0D7A4Y9_9AGAR|nr:PAPA-1-domain-containing protein [Fistulina hepatica ATCC 64428]